MSPLKKEFAVTALVKLARAKLLEVVRSMGGVVAAAKELGISNTTLSNWVYLRSMPACGSPNGQPWRPGSRRASVREAVRILCERAGMPPEELFPGYVRESLTGKSLTQEITRSVTMQALGRAEAKLLVYEEIKDEAIEREELRERLNRVMETLSFREREIVKARYGFGGGVGLNLEETGKRFGITKERVRQIEAKALRTMQQPQHAAELVPCL